MHCLCAVCWCIILRWGTRGSCKSHERHTKHSLFPVSLTPALRKDSPAAMSYSLGHGATVISIKYPKLLLPVKSSAASRQKLFWVFMTLTMIWSCLCVRLLQILPTGLKYHDKWLSGWWAERKPSLSWISPVSHEVDISPAHIVPSIGRNGILHSQLRGSQHGIIWLLFPVITAQICLSRVTQGQRIVYSWLTANNEPHSADSNQDKIYCVSGNTRLVIILSSLEKLLQQMAGVISGWPSPMHNQPLSVQWTLCKWKGWSIIHLHFPHLN